MSFLNKLPIPGRRSYEPNFKVRFKNGKKGLDEIVEQATSRQPGTFVLGETKMDGPLEEVKVLLEPGKGSVAAYRLTALLVSSGKEMPRINPSHLSGFRVDKGGNNDICPYFLHSQQLPSSIVYSRALTSGLNFAMSMHNDVVYGNRLTSNQVKDAVATFAKALEGTVNSVYNCNRKASPNKTLTLTAGEKLNLMQPKPAEQTLTKTQPPALGVGNAVDDSAKVSLDAITSNDSFADIGGYQNVKDELTMFLLGIKNPEMARRQGYTPAKGILLHGPPGTGKTMFGKAIAGEAGAQFFYVDPSELLNMYVGESPKALRQMFENAARAAKEKKKPAIVFMDEIDTILTKRNDSGGSGAVTSQLVNVFNQYMDGFKTDKIRNVYVVAATNRLSEMDEAAVRPPRFVHIEVPLPDLEARTSIFNVRTTAMEKEAGTRLFRPGIDYQQLAKQSDRYSGADIANVLTDVRARAFKETTEKGLKETRLTSQEELEAAIANYRPASDTNKGPIGFRTDKGGAK